MSEEKGLVAVFVGFWLRLGVGWRDVGSSPPEAAILLKMKCLAVQTHSVVSSHAEPSSCSSSVG